MEEDVKTVKDYVEILKRRKWSFFLPLVAVLLIALAVALLFPRTYRSTSTILIEEQEIPRDFVITTITGYAEQRLQAINQRIMSASRLIEIINRFNLYGEYRKKMAMEEIVDLMRNDIKFTTISSDVVDRRTGRPTAATIAFSLAYEGKNPQTVQEVANVLASLYLEENLKAREQQSAGTSKFLEEEAKTLQQALASVDAKIAVFKAKNINALPELVQTNYLNLDRIERDIVQLTDQLRTLQEKEGYLQVQIAAVPTESSNQDKNLLRELKAKLVQLQSRFSDKYPDVIKTKAEIAELERRVALSPPDEKQKAPMVDQPDNPSYVAIASQLAGVRSDIDSVKRQIVEARRKREDYRKRTEAGPRVEEAFKLLMTERNNTQAKYDDLMKKVMEARVAQGLEKGQMGERFTLIDPARLPEKPVSPNVAAILLIGLFLGLAAGVGTGSLREYGDQSVRSPAELAAATGFPVLATIPAIVTRQDRRKKKVRLVILMAGAVGVCAAAVLYFHLYLMDLEVFWAIVSRRLDL